MSLNYTTLVSSLINLLQEVGSADFTAIIPNIIDDAEQRIYREINFLAQREEDTSTTTTSAARYVSLSNTALPCMVVEQVALFTPAGQPSTSGTRVQYEGPVSIDVINTFWPQVQTTQAPSLYSQGYWAMFDEQTIALAPTPDASYTVGVTGIFRPLPMSASNATTYLGTYYPDLFLSACMVFGSAYQRDFGMMSEDPQKAISWESHYSSEKQSVIDEEARRRGESVGWTPMKQYIATPPRT